MATPLQVTLKVRIAEINRTLLKSMGINLLSSDSTGGFKFGIGQRQPRHDPAGLDLAPVNIRVTGDHSRRVGKLLGLDILGTLDIAATTAWYRSSPNRT